MGDSEKGRFKPEEETQDSILRRERGGKEDDLQLKDMPGGLLPMTLTSAGRRSGLSSGKMWK